MFPDAEISLEAENDLIEKGITFPGPTVRKGGGDRWWYAITDILLISVANWTRVIPLNEWAFGKSATLYIPFIQKSLL